MELICISNKSKNEFLKIGQKYRFDKHRDPKFVWIYFEFEDGKGLSRECYRSDFYTPVEWRDSRIEELLK
jgi:hypothetical protein